MARRTSLLARRTVGRIVAIGALGGVALGQTASGDENPGATDAGGQRRTSAPALVDRTVVRFYSPETGGAANPRFIFERVLAFEARLAQMAETSEGIGEAYGERDVREAIDHDIAEQMLASLADRLIAEAGQDNRPSADELAAVERDVGRALVERVGGRTRMDQAARAEQIGSTEVDAMIRRAALAAFYVDRAVTPILHPSDEQLRSVYRASAHPYHGQPFERVRGELERWFVIERIRVAESAYLQAARSRVRIIAPP